MLPPRLRHAAAAAALAAAAAAGAQDFRCAPLLPSRSQDPPYQRLGPARCEGFFERRVSQPFIELVSLTRGTPDPAATVLPLRGLPNSAAQLVVHPLRSGPFYRVDALLERDRTLVWDAAPMLSATGLRLRDLGFLALALPPGDDALAVLPVSLAAAPPAARTAQAVLRVSVPVSALAWRRYRLDGGDAGDSGWRELDGAPLYAWDRVPLTIELPADGRALRIDVQALDAQRKPLPLLRFVLVGPADGAR